MRIAVISDTHMATPDLWLASIYDRYLQDADAIVHCGDIGGEQTYHFLNSHPHLMAVSGNTDYWSGAGGPPDECCADLAGLRVAVCHGHLLGARAMLPHNMVARFGRDYDLACFGHTHKPYIGRLPSGGLLVNPGSLGLFGDPSLALVELGPGGLNARIVHLPRP